MVNQESNAIPHEHRPADIRRYARVYRAVDCIIVLTEWVGRKVVQCEASAAEKIVVIPHGDYEPLFARVRSDDALLDRVRKQANGRRIVAFLGAIRPYKGLDVFLDAMPTIQARDSNVFFLIAGNPLIGEPKRIRERLAQLVAPDDVWQDIRYLSTEELKTYVSVMDVLIQPYVEASQSGNTVMAYAAGVPVISSDIGGLSEMVADGETGYLVEPSDSEALANAVVRCFADENYDQLSRNATQMAKDKFSWQHIAEQTLAVYTRSTGRPFGDKSRTVMESLKRC